MLDIGRICLKTAGREAGRYCVIVKKIDENFVMITGPRQLTKVKRRRCNIVHLEPLEEKIKIKADATDAEILKECAKAGILSRLKLKETAATPKVKPEMKPEEKRAPKKEKAGLRERLRFGRKPKPEVKKPKEKKSEKPGKPKVKVKKPKVKKAGVKPKAKKAKKAKKKK